MLILGSYRSCDPQMQVTKMQNVEQVNEIVAGDENKQSLPENELKQSV